MYLVNQKAEFHFTKLAEEWEDKIDEIEELWMREIYTRRTKIEGRRGTAQAQLPIENIKNLFAWEVIQDGTQWVFRFGAMDLATGKEMRRMEYQRKVQYEVLKKDVPPKPGRPRKEDKELVTVTMGIGLGPIRYTKHILLETWEWSGGEGGRYQFTNVAPFKGRCIKIFNDAIKDMAKIAKGRRKR